MGAVLGLKEFVCDFITMNEELLIGAIPIVTVAQSAANWRKHAHSCGSHARIHSHTYINPVYNHVVRSASSCYYRIWNRIFILKVPHLAEANWALKAEL